MTPNVGGYFVEKFVATMYHYLQFAYYKREPPVGLGAGWGAESTAGGSSQSQGELFLRIQAPGLLGGEGVGGGGGAGERLRERAESSLRVND